MVENRKTVIPLEFPDEAAAYLKRYPRPQGDLIALTPKTHAYLKGRGFSPRTSASYFGSNAHQRMTEKAKEITEWVREQIFFRDPGGLEFSYTQSFVWYLHLACNHFLWLLELLHQIASQGTVDRIQFCSPRTVPIFGHYIWPQERYLGVIASAFGKSRGIEVDCWDPLPLGLRWVRWVRQRSHREAIAYLKGRWVTPLKSPKGWYSLLRLRSRRPIVFTSDKYRMKALFQELSRDHLRHPVTFLEALEPLPAWGQSWSFRRALSRKVRQLGETIRRETQRFSYHGVCFSPWIAQKVEKGILPLLFSLHRRAASLRRMLLYLQPELVISAGNRDDDSVMGELCERLGVKAIMLSHGSFVTPKNEYERYQWGEQSLRVIRAPFPYVALQSPLAEGFLNTLSAPGKKVRTGPLVWGGSVNRQASRALREKLFGSDPKRKVILYANTPKGRGAHRFFVYETPDEYIQSLVDLSQAVLQHPDYHLLIKFRPTYDMNEQDLRQLLPQSDRILIEGKMSFLDVLGLADLFVSFSSTTIEEALQNEIPVLLYGGGGRYQHVPAVEVSSSIEPPPAATYFVRRNEDLPQALRKILAIGHRPRELFQSYQYGLEARIPITALIHNHEGDKRYV